MSSIQVTQRELLYEGKAKILYKTDDPNLVIVHYKNDVTAGNGEMKDSIEGKGALNNKIASLLFTLLAEKGVPNHFRERLSEEEQLCDRVSIIPLEVIVRNVAAGSMAKRLGLEEGSELKTTVLELSYKDDDLGDPLINTHHAVGIGIATFEEVELMFSMASKVNDLLGAALRVQGILLVDFKVEFGKKSNGEIVLADEISPDTCRFWDLETKKKLDKDRFRRGMGGFIEAYEEIFERIKGHVNS